MMIPKDNNSNNISNSVSVDEVYSKLKTIMDPEINESIVDIGLIYCVLVDDDSKLIKIDMTLTSPACPLGGLIISDIHEVISKAFEPYRTEVNLVFEPMWTPKLMSDNLKKKFKLRFDET